MSQQTQQAKQAASPQRAPPEPFSAAFPLLV